MEFLHPFVKLNMTWESGLKTDVGYDRSTISTFAVSSKRVTETLTQGVDASVNYIFRNVRISFLPKLRNNIDMSLRGSYKNDTEISYKLDTDLDNALQDLRGAKVSRSAPFMTSKLGLIR